MLNLGQLRAGLDNLIKSLQALPKPLLKTGLDEVVLGYLNNGPGLKRHAEWDCLFREQIFAVCANESRALQDHEPSYYQDLVDRLDVVLTFSEFKACDPQLPLSIVEDLLETQTVASCLHIFSWLELRYQRIIVDIYPNKGKGLTLLRTLNDLLRRISKTGDATNFCGRILIFLSSVFPFGERSGVNLRGEYGPPWVPVAVAEPETKLNSGGESSSEQQGMEQVSMQSASQDSVKKPSPEKTPEEKKVEFYNTFWSLQTFFARPQTFTEPEALKRFKASVTSVLSVLIEATKKEQALMGAGHRGGVSAGVGVPTGPSGMNTKRKRAEFEGSNQNAATAAAQEYFFAKFLTSPDLLDFELSDALFRRQVLVQLLILIRHLVTFSTKEKAIWITPRNRTLHMDFTLLEEDEKWLKELWSKTALELRNTTPDGRAFASTVSVILERDRNWVRWKNDMCPPIGKLPTKDVDMTGEASAKAEKEWKKVFEPYIHTDDEGSEERPVPYGSVDLSDTWTLGYRDLEDLQNPREVGDIKTFQRMIRSTEAQRDMVRKRKGLPPLQSSIQPAAGAAVPQKSSTPGVTDTPQPTASASPQRMPLSLGAEPKRADTPVRNTVPIMQITPLEADHELEEFNMRKQSITWRALRLAVRQGHLHLFNKIDIGDVDLLVQEINKPRPRPPVAPTQTANQTAVTSLPTTPSVQSANTAVQEQPVDGEVAEVPNAPSSNDVAMSTE